MARYKLPTARVDPMSATWLVGRPGGTQACIRSVEAAVCFRARSQLPE